MEMHEIQEKYRKLGWSSVYEACLSEVDRQYPGMDEIERKALATKIENNIYFHCSPFHGTARALLEVVQLDFLESVRR